MKKLFALLLLVGFFACQQNEKSPISTTNSTTEQPKGAISVLLNENPELKFENLRVFPIVASPEIVAQNAPLAKLKTTAEAMQTPGFRITELKPFGRESGHQVGGLTAANKSGDAVFLMSGDVVTGGNQDRVIADDQVIAANSIKNIQVFCVEHGRWQFHDENASASERKVAAFNGYYNVASTEVRKAIQRTGSQQEVWDAVDRVTSANAAATSTKTYAGLETQNEFKSKRDACMKFFEGKFENLENVVGFVVVSGDKILGVDIFGHPDLFRRQAKSLLHGFATDALTAENSGKTDLAEVENVVDRFQNMFAQTNEKGNEKIGKFTFEGLPVHVFSK